MGDFQLTDDTDLLGDVCIDLTLDTGQHWISASRDVERQISALMQEARGKRDHPGGAVAVYLQELDEDELIVGSLFYREDSRFALRISVPMDQPPPTDQQFSPFADLLEITSDLLGEITVTCTAAFAYSQDESLIKLPSPLLLPSRDGMGVTHVESVNLSRRTPEGLSHSIEVSHSDTSVFHSVSLEAKGVITWQGLCTIRTVAERLSRALIAEPLEESS